MLPVWRQTLTQTSADLSSLWPFGTNCCEISIQISKFVSSNISAKISVLLNGSHFVKASICYASCFFYSMPTLCIVGTPAWKIAPYVGIFTGNMGGCQCITVIFIDEKRSVLTKHITVKQLTGYFLQNVILVSDFVYCKCNILYVILIGPISVMFCSMVTCSARGILMAWCFSTRASVATVLIKHPQFPVVCVSLSENKMLIICRSHFEMHFIKWKIL